MLNVVLYQPENPYNTGAIARTCVMLNAHLHLIQPYGFGSINRNVRRSSMNYLDDVQLTEHACWEAFMLHLNANARVFAFTDKASTIYSSISFEQNDYLVFGRESDGLPQALLLNASTLCIPMPGSAHHFRLDRRDHSLNVSVSVAIALSEAVRQIRQI